jgi:hypothetical protein
MKDEGGSIPILQIAHRLPVCGYTNNACSNRQVFLQKWDAPDEG